jgi:large subunit ribosomal protein L24
MFKIKVGDIVQVTKGKDKGKKGKVLEIVAEGQRVLVEGLNLAKKHMRKKQQDQKTGIVSIEVPLSISNVMFLCKSCNAAVRLGFSRLQDGTKVRICKKCKATL